MIAKKNSSIAAPSTRAPSKYFKKFSRYPTRIEDLENTNNVRFLRSATKIPSPAKISSCSIRAKCSVGRGAGIAGATSAARHGRSLRAGAAACLEAGGALAVTTATARSGTPAEPSGVTPVALSAVTPAASSAAALPILRLAEAPDKLRAWTTAPTQHRIRVRLERQGTRWFWSAVQNLPGFNQQGSGNQVIGRRPDCRRGQHQQRKNHSRIQQEGPLQRLAVHLRPRDRLAEA